MNPTGVTHDIRISCCVNSCLLLTLKYFLAVIYRSEVAHDGIQY